MWPIGQKTYVMGILNVTPDSFSDGGLYTTLDGAVQAAMEMEKFVDIVDLGGQSTRPGQIQLFEKTHSSARSTTC